MKQNDNSKLKDAVRVLKELGIKVSVAPSRLEIMNRISNVEQLKLNENNI